MTERLRQRAAVFRLAPAHVHQDFSRHQYRIIGGEGLDVFRALQDALRCACRPLGPDYVELLQQQQGATNTPASLVSAARHNGQLEEPPWWLGVLGLVAACWVCGSTARSRASRAHPLGHWGAWGSWPPSELFDRPPNTRARGGAIHAQLGTRDPYAAEKRRKRRRKRKMEVEFPSA